MHGMNEAKYTESTSMNFQLDKGDERQMLIDGKLEELKSNFKIN